jgi:malate dehydrogenase (quinone)
VGQVVESDRKRFDAPRVYFPKAVESDWRLEVAGQRVQIIKRNRKPRGMLEFGTEIVHCADGSLAALLGASPGASTSAAIMVGVIEQCFPEQLSRDGWKDRLTEMIPSYGQSLIDDAELCDRVRRQTAEVLHLHYV